MIEKDIRLIRYKTMANKVEEKEREQEINDYLSGLEDVEEKAASVTYLGIMKGIKTFQICPKQFKLQRR